MDEHSLIREKLDSDLAQKLREENYEPLKVIIQTEDGLKDADKTLMKSLGGKIKDDLYIINAFSAEITAEALRKLILSPRILKVFNDGKVQAM